MHDKYLKLGNKKYTAGCCEYLSTFFDLADLRFDSR